MTKLKTFPLISVKGGPYECGRQHGEQARELVQRQLKFYFDLWQKQWNAKRENILNDCRAMIPVIEDYSPAILQELEGLAKGTRVTLEEIVALNARYELVWTLNLLSVSKGDGCTSLSALPEVTELGHTILGHNRDYLPIIRERMVLLEIRQQDKPNITMLTEAGIIGSVGMNSIGLGVTGNGLVSSVDKFELKTPIFLLMREILNSDSFSNAIEAVLTTKTSVSTNYMIAHEAGEVIDLEVTPNDVGFLHAEDGILSHSNNFLYFTNREDLLDIFKAALPDTLFRFSRARRLLGKEHGKIGIESFQRVFSDHFSYPNSICRHPDSRDEEFRQLCTINSVIMDLNERALFIAEGPPCTHKYNKISPESLRES
ncbi:MAG TPA: C45 family autoproteolytic acyltransferase/hydrolase [Syntrophorhabdaceae bacterium]|nr:C45 family autoproteolytic acyltransferase/hydrolase [Syntrophorhabdaceae bacterium]HQM81377.1 C45 family autoproteolytic acyltransferase/hydrolase [Syntrophorhabdaceae bacterium]